MRYSYAGYKSFPIMDKSTIFSHKVYFKIVLRRRPQNNMTPLLHELHIN